MRIVTAVTSSGPTLAVRIRTQGLDMTPEDSLEMLKWLSARNAHVPVSELAFLLGLPVAEGNRYEMGDEVDHPPLLAAAGMR
jgi:hypothetical protein